MKKILLVWCLSAFLAGSAEAVDLVIEMPPAGGELSVELTFAEESLETTMSIVAIGELPVTSWDVANALVGVGSGSTPSSCVEVTSRNPSCAGGFTGTMPGTLVIHDKKDRCPSPPCSDYPPVRRGCRVFLDSDPSTPEIDKFSGTVTLNFAMCAGTFPPTIQQCTNVWSSNPSQNNGTDGFSNETTQNFDHVCVVKPSGPVGDSCARTTQGPFPLNALGYLGPQYQNKVYQLRWEGSPGSFANPSYDDLVATVRVDGDMDRDGLWDDWETHGIDSNADGTAEFTLTGANMLHKDLYLEIDWMRHPDDPPSPFFDFVGHDPSDAIADTVQAFADAPVPNPDTVDGITLHADVDEKIPHEDDIWAFSKPACCFSLPQNCTPCANTKCDNRTYGEIKCERFGTAAERASGFNLCDSVPPPQLLARSFAYRYALFAHQYTYSGDFPNAPGPPTPNCGPSGSSGIAELPGNDSIVSLGAGGWQPRGYYLVGGTPYVHNVGSVKEKAGTLLHEFGHNVKLYHGGDADHCGQQYKPNFLSIMNYSFQTRWLESTDHATSRLDYSRDSLPALNEAALNENYGVTRFGPDPDMVSLSAVSSGDRTCWCTGSGRIVCEPTGLATLQDAPLDWNGNGDPHDSNVVVEINNPRSCDASGNCVCGGDSPSPVGETLTGHDDWPGVFYDFHVLAAYDNGAPGVDNSGSLLMLPPLEPELTDEQASAIRQCASNQFCLPESRLSWDAQCASPGSIPASDACVASSRAFSSVTSVGQACAIVQQPDFDDCSDADRELMALTLNLCSDQLHDCCRYSPSNPPNATGVLDTSRNVGEVFEVVDALLSNPARTQADCSRAAGLVRGIHDQSRLAHGAGRVPDGGPVPGVPLDLRKIPGTEDLSLSWGASCNPSTSDYEIYEGTLGSNFTSHGPILCSTGGMLTQTITPAAGGTYYLVVPRNVTREGSYGTDSSGSERPRGAVACLDRAIDGCVFF